MEGISSSQGLHHVAQKLRNTTLPLNSPRLLSLPSRSGNSKSMACVPATTSSKFDFFANTAISTIATETATIMMATGFTPFLPSCFSFVKSRQYEADSPIQEYDREKSEYGQIRRLPSPPSPRNPRVQIRRVYEPRYKRPRLFRVPAPISSPRVVGPYRARDYAYREERKPPRDGPVPEFVEHLASGEPVHEDVRFLHGLVTFLYNIHYRDAERYGEGCVTHERRKHVKIKPAYGVLLQPRLTQKIH